LNERRTLELEALVDDRLLALANTETPITRVPLKQLILIVRDLVSSDPARTWTNAAVLREVLGRNLRTDRADINAGYPSVT